MRTTNLLSTLVAGLLCAILSLPSYGSAIVIAPGESPPGAYLPLSLFGVDPIGSVGDETISNFNVPSFTFAGQSWTRLGIVSNGYALAGGGTQAGVQFLNASLPNNTAPRNMLAPFWTDLNPAASGAVRIAVLTDGVDQWIVVDWNAVRNFSDATLNSFELWLGTNGDANPAEDISFVYGLVGNGDGGLLTVGAQDASGTVGDTYYFNGVGTLPVRGTQLKVTAHDLPVSVPEPATIALFGLALAGMLVSRRRQHEL